MSIFEPFDYVADQLQDVVKAIRSSRPPVRMTTRVIAVDGHGAAGKSTLADRLAQVLDAPVVRTDDFASWDNPIDWWPDLIEKVLRPIAAGKPARYQPTSWGGPAKPSVVIEPDEFLLLEGVTASREVFREYLAFSIWIETPRDLRLRRGLERDGVQALADWERWMAAEDAYVKREQPAAHADLVLRGDRRSGSREVLGRRSA